MKRFAPIAFLLPALACGLSGARAAVSVSDTAASGTGPYTLHYLLNQAAASGTIQVALASAPDVPLATITLAAKDLSKGPHDYRYTPSGLASGQYVFQVSVTAAANAGYTVLTPATSIASGATVAYGTRVNRTPGTLTYQHIYLADYGTAKALHEFRADGVFLKDVATKTADTYAFVADAVDVNGHVYGSSQDTDTIDEYAPSGTPAAPTWSLVKEYTGPPPTYDPTLGVLPTRGFQVFGSGAAAHAYLTDYTASPNAVTLANFSDVANPPAPLFAVSGMPDGRADQILVSPDERTITLASGSVYGTGLRMNRWVYGPDAAIAGTTDWHLDPDFLQNDPARATLTGRARGLALSPDGQTLYVTQTGSADTPANFIAALTANGQTTSIPTLARALQIAGGLAPAGAADIPALDPNGNKKIEIDDAIALARSSTPAGTLTGKIPMPSGAPLPVSLDVDAKGNLVVVANSSTAADGTTGNVFFILAPPDNGSSDTTTSPAFQIG